MHINSSKNRSDVERRRMSSNVTEESVFGDLYDWKYVYNSSLNYIQSLQITDNFDFFNEDLELICHTSDLRQLFLHNLPNLTTLPAAIMKLKNLDIISITQCVEIKTLPLSFRFLFKLKTLRIDYDNFQTLPISLAFMPSLQLLLLRKTISICNQCKFYSLRTGRIVILPYYSEDFTDDSSNKRKYNPNKLSILATNSFLSLSTEYQSLFNYIVEIKLLWPCFKETFDLDVCRCTICFRKCEMNQLVTVSFTRFYNCKCIHLQGCICSEDCKSKLKDLLLFYHQNNSIITTRESLCYDNYQQRRDYFNNNIGRRIRRTLIRMFTCVPIYYKRSYSVTTN